MKQCFFCFFFSLPQLCCRLGYSSLCFPSRLKARQEQPVSPYVGLQGVGQLLLKLLVKLPSPALAWIPELCGADFTDQSSCGDPCLALSHPLLVPTPV